MTEAANLKKVPGWVWIAAGGGALVGVFILLRSRQPTPGQASLSEATESFMSSGFTAALESTKDLIGLVRSELSDEIESLQSIQSDVALELITLGQADTALGDRITTQALAAKSDLESTANTINQAIAVVSDRVLSLEQFRSSAQAVIDQLKAQGMTTLARVADAEGALATVRQSIAGLTGQYGTLTTLVNQTRSQISSIIAQQQTQRNDLTGMQNSVNAIHQAIASMAGQITSLVQTQNAGLGVRALVQMAFDSARDQLARVGGPYWRTAPDLAVWQALEDQPNLLAGQPIGSLIRNLWFANGIWQMKPAEIPLPPSQPPSQPLPAP